jgi:hypothetical protein
MIGAPKPSSASWAAAAATSCPPSSRSDSFFALSSAALRSFCVFITPIPSNKRCQSTRQIRTAPVAHAMHQVQEATVGEADRGREELGQSQGQWSLPRNQTPGREADAAPRHPTCARMTDEHVSRTKYTLCTAAEIEVCRGPH